jgi:hypothetical protein
LPKCSRLFAKLLAHLLMIPVQAGRIHDLCLSMHLKNHYIARSQAKSKDLSSALLSDRYFFASVLPVPLSAPQIAGPSVRFVPNSISLSLNSSACLYSSLARSPKKSSNRTPRPSLYYWLYTESSETSASQMRRLFATFQYFCRR